MLILYATQTGNAQDVAERIGREVRRVGHRARVLPTDSFDARSLSAEPVVVLVASTTGQGDPPDSFRALWRSLLVKSLPPGLLSSLHYAVFGLGDSGYINYNVVAKKLFRRLEALGGKPLVELGLGDDQHRKGYEGGLAPWLTTLLAALPPAGGSDVNGAAPPPAAAPLEDLPRYSARPTGTLLDPPVGPEALFREAISAAAAFNELSRRVSGGGEATAVAAAAGGGAQWGPANPFFAPVRVNRRLTAQDHFQDVRHLELDISGSGLQYAPGDVASILPWVPDDAVSDLCLRVGLRPEAEVEVGAGPGSEGEGEGGTFRCRLAALVRGALDVCGASPRRYFFEVAARHAAAAHEAERLEYFSSGEGLDDLYQYNQRERRSVLEVLSDFPSVRLPLAWLLQLVPRLQPRQFSIASAQAADRDSLHLTVAIVNYKTPWKRPREGLCTKWLAGLTNLSDTATPPAVPLWIGKGSLPLHPTAPLIMVGPGTGLAPMRSFLRHRGAGAGAGAASPGMLFFGCRNEKGDFLYRDELEAYQDGSVLLSAPRGLQVAFSRDQPSKVYVQHRILERVADVWSLISQGGVVYVSGSSGKMPADVAAALKEVAAREGPMDAAGAERWMKAMVAGGRYFVETWG